MGTPQRPITSTAPKPPPDRKKAPKLNWPRGGAGGRDIYRGREGRKEGGREVGETILGFWFKFVSKKVCKGGS